MEESSELKLPVKRGRKRLDLPAYYVLAYILQLCCGYIGMCMYLKMIIQAKQQVRMYVILKYSWSLFCPLYRILWSLKQKQDLRCHSGLSKSCWFNERFGLSGFYKGSGTKV